MGRIVRVRSTEQSVGHHSVNLTQTREVQESAQK